MDMVACMHADTMRRTEGGSYAVDGRLAASTSLWRQRRRSRGGRGRRCSSRSRRRPRRGASGEHGGEAFGQRRFTASGLAGGLREHLAPHRRQGLGGVGRGNGRAGRGGIALALGIAHLLSERQIAQREREKAVATPGGKGRGKGAFKVSAAWLRALAPRSSGPVKFAPPRGGEVLSLRRG